MAASPLNKRTSNVSDKFTKKLGCDASTGDKIYWDPVKDAAQEQLGCNSSTGDKIYWTPVKLDELKQQLAAGKINIKDLDPELVKKLR